MSCFLVSLILSVVLSKYYKPKLSPDGKFYMERPEVRPYCMRRLLPWVLGSSLFRWEAVSYSCSVVTATIVGLYCGTPWASACVLGLPLLRQAFCLPVLADPPGLMFLAMSVYTGRWEWAAFGGLFNEKSPVFGGILVSPMAFVGLIPPVALLVAGKRPLKSDPEWLRSPLKEGWKWFGRLGEPKISIFPWGGALIGFPFLDFKGWTSVLAGYLQLLVAQDGPRVYQWCFLPVLKAIPTQFMPLAAVLCWVNPERERI